ncbi:5'-nucleotidase C-terminal domain-containing protein [Kribbella catacumbae]|uniref:5'-nucleotidase C-terminal domain-containing protein n=1 Tax=Kribbella catacumbae TaxID=460086 RepID=UPI000364BFDD|nr:5'-nucleotidase C-terminal domain-containing protein [Kribbella catacumbae]
MAHVSCLSGRPFGLTSTSRLSKESDLHGNVFNWDYFKNAEYDDTAHNDIGLAKISTLVDAVRSQIAADRRAPKPLMLDAGDTIQGTPLAYYFAKIQPITGGHLHPMAAAMNEIGYDAAALGNHEFNYGLDRAAAIPAGEVSVRDVAGLYIFDNTLIAVTMTGAQVKDYLEFSARYFKQVSGPGPFPSDQVTNAPTPTAPSGTPDYNYDIMGGLAKPMAYKIDIAKPAGSRITDLQCGGVPVTADQQFVVAVNNYRQSGGGNFPHVKTAPVVYNRQVEIHQLMIDYVTTTGEVNPNTFHATDWSLTANGAPVVINP